MGMERIVLKTGKMTGYFISDQQSKFYQSTTFQKVLTFVQRNADKCRMTEKQTRNGLRLLLIFDKIISVDKALNMLQLFKE